MNCHGPVKNQWRCDIFPFVRVCLLVLWLSTWSPLLAACGRVRGKKRWFPTGGCFPVAAEMRCAGRGPEWRFSLDCWPPPQIFAERGGGFVPFASSQGHNLQHMAGSQRYQGLWLDWKRNCLNASVFIIAAVKYVKPQESKSKNGDTGSCPSLGTGHSKCPGKSTGTEQAHMKPSCPSYCPPSFSPPPAQGIASSGSNRAAQKRQSRGCFTNWFGTLAGSTFLLCPKDTVAFVTSLQGKPWVWP